MTRDCTEASNRGASGRRISPDSSLPPLPPTQLHHAAGQRGSSRRLSLLNRGEQMHPFLSLSAVRRLLVITALVFAATGTAHAGAAFVQQATLTASDAAAQDKLGARVAVSGSTMVVGSVAHNS